MTRPLSGVRADQGYSYANLERLAEHVREQLGMSLSEALKPLAFFENLNEISIERSSGPPIPLGYGVVELTNSEGYARYDSDRKVIEVLASVQTYQWLEDGHPRATFFVAHELGHCVLHTDQLVRLARMPTSALAALHRGKTQHRPFLDTEWQANAFACALLMPAAGLAVLEKQRGGLDVDEIAYRYGVSAESAGYRLENFNQRRAELLRR